MESGLKKLNRLRGKSIRELRVRGRQELAKIAERNLGLAAGEMSDRAFLRQIKPENRGASAEATADLIINRLRSSISKSPHSKVERFFPSLGCRDEIVARMGREYKHEREAIIQRAERAVRGRFDLLGFKDLSFGNPPDWLLEPISGKRSTLEHWSKIDYLDPKVAGDKKITWELNRHQHFVTLGQAYWMTGDEKYAKAFVSQSTSWMDANPPNRGINWVSSLELALRSIAWLWALHLFAGSQCLTAKFELRLLKHLLANGRRIHLYPSHYFSPNTHLTGEALGLFYLGTALQELRYAEEWRTQGLEIMLEELARQIRSDGVYFEQTTYYHRYTADFYTHLLILARAGGIMLPPQAEEKLAQLITHLVCIMRPDGSSPLIGDDDGGRLMVLGPRPPDDFRDTVATAAALYGRGDWKRGGDEGGAVETLWLLGPEGADRYTELQTYNPRDLSRVFQISGQVVMRDGWSKDSTYTLMDCGPHGSLAYGHSHADALSIEFAALGKTWIVDPGTFTYTADSESRNWFRSTEAHNTVTVDGKSQSVPAGPFSWEHVAQTSLNEFIIGGGFDYIEASHNGYERLSDPVKHTRTVINPKVSENDKSSVSLPSYLIVRDSFIASGHHRYAIRYHLAPGCLAFATENHVSVREPGGLRLDITVFGPSRLRARIDKSWVSRAYGQRERSLVVVFEASGDGTQEFTTFIMPAFEGQSIAVEQQRSDYAGSRVVQVVSGGTRDVLLSNSDSGPIRCGALAAAGSFAWARFEDSVFSHGFLIHGQRLETSDGFVFRAASPINHCFLRRTMEGVEGSINGSEVFGLGIGEQSKNFVIGGVGIEVAQPGMPFASEDSMLNVINTASSEAIN